jgi:O-antigen ligase
MIRKLLLVLFIALIVGRAIGLDTGLGPGLSIKNALIYVVATFIAVEAVVAGNRRIQLLPVLLPFAVLIGYALLSWAFIVIFVDDPGYSARETLIRLKTKLVDQFIVLLIFYYGVVNRDDVLWLMKGVTWAVVFGCLITVIDTYDIPDLGIVTAREDDGRIEGIIGAAAEFGGLLAFYVPPIFALAVSSAGMKKLGAMVGVAATLMSVMLSASRGAMLAIITGAVAAAVYLRAQLNVRTLVRTAFISLILVAIAATFVVYSEYGSLLRERLMTGLETGSAESVSSGRTAIWAAAMRDMANAPMSVVTGLGWETYFQGLGRKLATHNVFLDRLYNLGLIGLTLFVAFHVAAILILRRGVSDADTAARPYVVAAVIGLISFMVAMLFTDLQIAGTYMWAYVGLALRAVSPQELASAQDAPFPETRRRMRLDTNTATRPISATPKR